MGHTFKIFGEGTFIYNFKEGKKFTQKIQKKQHFGKKS